jgi:hypothetical protein
MKNFKWTHKSNGDMAGEPEMTPVEFRREIKKFKEWRKKQDLKYKNKTR